MSNHTPTPWKIDEAAEFPLAIIQDDEDGMGVVELPIGRPATAREVADFNHIVKAVNHHDELVAALKACYERLGSHDDRSAPELLLCEAVFAKLTPRTVKRVLELTEEEDADVTDFFRHCLDGGTWDSDENARKALAREWKKGNDL